MPDSIYLGALDTFKNSIDTNKFNVGFVTDSHYDFGTWRANASRSIQRLNNLLYLRDFLDVQVAGGDNTDSEQNNPQANKRIMEQYMRFFRSGDIDSFAIRGNHDAGSLYPESTFGKVLPNQVVSTEDMKNIFRSDQNLYGEIRNGDSLYGYKDYSTKKIRLVFVDTVDNPIIVNGDGSLKYIDQHDYGYQQEQLEWITDKALGECPDDYHVIMFGHVPLRIRAGEEERATRNFQCLIDILKAFCNRERKSIISTLPDYNVNLSVDYTNRSSGNFIGFFAGHDHAESVVDHGEFKTIVSTRHWCSDTIDVVNEDSFQVIEVDTSSRKYNIKGFGRSTNRTFTY